MNVFDNINDMIWSVALVLIIIVGIVLTVKLKGIQVTHFKDMVSTTFRNDDNSENTGISSFQAFILSMGSRIGVGNITGPALAILVGGPGSVFWMWIFALLGMATSFIETTVGQIYKTRGDDGICRGGPAYYISNGLGWKKLGLTMGLMLSLMYIVGFVSMEVNSMGMAFDMVFKFEYNNVVFAFLITLVALTIIITGLKKIASASTWIVPVMVFGWFAICIATIIFLPGGIINAFGSIFQYAFNPPAIIGGGIGLVLVTGMKRGLLSNEAGVGTIPCISSMADVSHPVKQGLSQSIGVLVDTLVCTLTALVILSYGSIESIIHDFGGESVPTILNIFGYALGSSATLFIAAFLFVFALTSMMSDFIIGQNNLAFVTKKKEIMMASNLLILAVVFLTGLFANDSLFVVVDILLGVCAVINAIVITKLGKYAIEAFKDYNYQKSKGIDPVFSKDALSNTVGVTEWDSKD